MKIFTLALFSLFTLGVTAQKFTPVDEGSKIEFIIKNFGLNTDGGLSGLKGSIIFDAKKPAQSSFDVTVAVKTIDTDNEGRDDHLRADDFFHEAKYPVIRLASTSIIAGADLKHFTFKGNITIKGVTKPVEFPFTAEGATGGAMFKGKFDIDRNDFGIGGSSSTMGDKVKIELEVFAKAGA